LFDDIAKRYQNGRGGYLRIVQYSPRWGDGAQRAFIELTTKPVAEEAEKTAKGAKKKATKQKETAPAPEPKKTRKKATKKEKETETE
jgi:hypothetical protein